MWRLTTNYTQCQQISVNVPEFVGVCKLRSWLETVVADDDANAAALYWAVADRDAWFRSTYGWYPASIAFALRISDWDDAAVVRPTVVSAVLAADVLLCVAGKGKSLYTEVFSSLVLLRSVYISFMSLNNVPRRSEVPANESTNESIGVCRMNARQVERFDAFLWRSEVPGDELTGCICVSRVCARQTESFEASARPAEERLLDAGAEDSASEYEIPLLAAGGPSSDLVPGDLHTVTDVEYGYPCLWLNITFDTDCVDLGRFDKGDADSHLWWVDGGNKGECKLGDDCAADSGVDWVLATDGATMAVERFVLELTYGGNESRRISVDGKPWTLVRSMLDVDNFTGENWDELVTLDDAEVGDIWVIRINSSNWKLLAAFGETTAAASGAFLSEELPKTNHMILYNTVIYDIQKLKLNNYTYCLNNNQMFSDICTNTICHFWYDHILLFIYGFSALMLLVVR